MTDSGPDAERTPIESDASPLGLPIVAIVLLFAFLRLTIALIRDPFFDELFTRWITQFSPSMVLEHLEHDSGPPLYYLIASILPSPSSVISLRVLSVGLALIAMIAVLKLVPASAVRGVAALLLATWPVHVMLSTDARAYALLASCTGVAVLALWRWVERPSRRWLALATLALVVAVWTHWYGFLFLPALVVSSLFVKEQRVRRLGEACAATAIAVAFVIPAYLLLVAQPQEAAQWMSMGAAGDPWLTLESMAMTVSPTPTLEPGVLPKGSHLLAIAGFIATLALIAWGWRRSRDLRLMAALTIVPMIGALALVSIGQPAYYPGRFESSIAVPLCVTIALGLSLLPKRVGRAALVLWFAIGTGFWASFVVQLPKQVPDPWRLTAQFTRERVAPTDVIVATGPMYLELVSQTSEEWSPPILAFPAEQALHPGWRARVDMDDLESGAGSLPRTAWWTGELSSGELRVLAERYRIEPEFRAGPVGLARISVPAE